MNQAQTIGRDLINLCNQGKDREVVNKYYANTIVSVEPEGAEGNPAQIEGIEALLAKHDWWNTEVEVHSAVAKGPFFGNNESQFAVVFELDFTPPGAARLQSSEVALYDVAAGKIVREQFLTHAD